MRAGGTGGTGPRDNLTRTQPLMLSEDQRRQIEQRLLREREQVLDALGDFDETAKDLRERLGELSLADNHPADYATDHQEHEKDFHFATMEGRRLYAIDESLRQLYKEPESFGLCQVCGNDIGMERLDVIPETRLCAVHARERDAAADVDANPREADGNAQPA